MPFQVGLPFYSPLNMFLLFATNAIKFYNLIYFLWISINITFIHYVEVFCDVLKIHVPFIQMTLMGIILGVTDGVNRMHDTYLNITQGGTRPIFHRKGPTIFCMIPYPLGYLGAPCHFSHYEYKLNTTKYPSYLTANLSKTHYFMTIPTPIPIHFPGTKIKQLRVGRLPCHNFYNINLRFMLLPLMLIVKKRHTHMT